MVLLFVWLALCVGLSRALGECEQTGENAPTVVTLTVSKTNPESDAWVVKPSCEVDVYNSGGFSTSFSQRSDIERIDSVPTQWTSLSILGSPLSRGADLSTARGLNGVDIGRLAGVVLPKTLNYLHVSGSSLTSVAGVVLPDSITEIEFSSTPLASLEGLKLPGRLTKLRLTKSKLTAIGFTIPPQLEYLSIADAPLTSLKGITFPVSLTVLELSSTRLTAIDFDIPPNLMSLSVSSTAISRIERVNFPATFKSLACESSGLTTVRGIKWPRSLNEMRLGGNPIVNFEIRRTDLALFKVMIASPFFSGEIVQPTCADWTAQVVIVGGKQLCVISDDRFEAVHVNGNGQISDAPGTSVGTTAGSGSGALPGTGTTAGGKPTDSRWSGSSSSTDSTKPSIAGGQNSTASGAANYPRESDNGAMSTSFDDSMRSPSPRKPGVGPIATNNVTNSIPSNTALVIGVCCGGGMVLAAVIGLCGYVAKRRRLTSKDGDDKYEPLRTPQTSSTGQTAPVSDHMYLSNDVRNDQALIPYRIEQHDLPSGEQIAMSKTSVTYKSTFQGQDVAVRHLSAGSWEDQRKLSRFMDEIRACASLEHHKIVAFIGIAWSSARDLSVVMELMPLGDLGTHLLNHQGVPTAEGWVRPWSSSHVKSKTAIAQDVAEALVYLHSFNNPILHRNLKARNVLLDLQGNAKLSGFGISRESSLDATMTGEIGTAAWIAPEVLRGERYDEKVDVYSLGVLLVEMDRCQHPYANDSSLQGRDGQIGALASARRETYTIAPNNTQIAVLVSSGKLRPSVSSECPEPVASLATECLSFDPADRPTSMAVFYRLRQARKALGHC